MKKCKNIIVTGAAGYIGSHTLVELFKEQDVHVIPIDNYCNSSPQSYRAVEEITGKKIREYQADIRNSIALEALVHSYGHIDAVIHFAALKSVPESIVNPQAYYSNNIDGLATILQWVKKHRLPNFIFSSSCAVYGDSDSVCIDEDTPIGEAKSPYAFTKQVGEKMLKEFALANPWFNYTALRYFNPAGYHPSGLLGENPNQPPQSLVPLVCSASLGKKMLTILGDDYATPDGTCIRDYVHVCDIAQAHVLALRKMLHYSYENTSEVFNLGTGKGYSVKEVISAFEHINNTSVPHTIGPRREGDIVSIYASNQKAIEKLGWKICYSLQDMVKTAWAFYQR